MTAPSPLVVTPVAGLPEVDASHGLTGLGRLLANALRAQGIAPLDGDVLVVSSKVVSKALGLRAPALDQAATVLAQSRRVVAERRTEASVTRIVEAIAGPVMAAAGVDASNTGADDLLLLPADPDACAAELLTALRAAWCAHDQDQPDGRPRVGLLLSDTAGRPWRAGQTDFALGAAGFAVLDDLRGRLDADGRDLSVTVRCLADEVAAAADLVKGKDRGIALAHVRGLAGAADPRPGARQIVRTGPADWFALGTYESVRAALGVPPGSSASRRLGIPSVLPEDLATRASRAAALAVAGLGRVSAHLEPAPDASAPTRLVLRGTNPLLLGRALGRLEAALWAERLVTTGEITEAVGQVVVTVGERESA